MAGANGQGRTKGSSRWDVVCLQELWCSEDWEYLSNRLRESGSGLVHGRYFYSGALGSGLCILSRFPIVATSTWPYSLNGNPLHVIQGDFYVAKACGSATLDLGPEFFKQGSKSQLVTVLNTHFFAPGGEGGDEWKRAHRLAQAWELSRLVNVASERGHHVIVAGDLNSIPTSLVIQLLLSNGRLSDAWSTVHPPATHSFSDTLNAESAIELNGITCDSPLNSWSASKTFGEDVTRQKGKRLDYLLYRKGRGSRSRVNVKECKVTARDIVQSLGCSLSDHFGVEAVFEFPSSPIPVSSSRSQNDDSLQEEEDEKEAELIPPRSPAFEVLHLARAAITLYTSHSTRYSNIQLRLFALSLSAIPILSVASCFQPLRYLNWIFVLLGIANGVGGATMLYTGFVGGRWETSALKNAVADMGMELDRLEHRRLR